MDNSYQTKQILYMPSEMRSKSWVTTKSLHQVQILSCDLSHFTRWNCTDHCAPFWRIYWHDRKGAELQFEHERLEVQPHSLVLIPPNTHFSSRLRCPVRQLFLHFLVEPRLRQADQPFYVIPRADALRTRCEDIIRILKTDTSNIHASFHAQILASSALLALPAPLWATRFEDARITRATEAIAQAYPKKIPLSRLARGASMHPSAFGRLFRKLTGHTPLQHLLNLRLEEACSMLHYDEASLDEIAERTGFGERNYFTRIFTRSMNCSPARYRRLVNVAQRLRPGE